MTQAEIYAVQSSLLTKAKRHTYEIHAELERTSPLQPVIDGTDPIVTYYDILQRIAPFYHHIYSQTQLFNWAKTLCPHLIQPNKYILLIQELEEQNLAAPDTIQVAPWIDWDDLSMMLGLIYVVEGATLGGMVIAKSMQRHYGFNQDKITLFQPYSYQCMQNWQYFCQIITAIETTLHEEAFLHAALTTFDQYGCFINEKSRTIAY